MNTSLQVTRWNPLREMEQMRNRLAHLWNWDPLRSNGGKGENLIVAEWSPRVDIVEDEKEIIVKAELPDLKREDVEVTVDEGVFTLSGERKLEKEEKNKRYHAHREQYGSFLRSFTLPAAIVADKVHRRIRGRHAQGPSAERHALGHQGGGDQGELRVEC
jgi:HSP20 family protein